MNPRDSNVRPGTTCLPLCAALVGMALALACLAHPACAQEASEPSLAERLLDDLACGTCHDGVDVESGIRDRAPDLSEAGIRYSPEYLLGFLRYPVSVRESIGLSRMPDFGLDEAESLALTLFLGEQVPEGRTPPDFPALDAFERARAAHPEVTARLGEELFVNLNCGACHQMSSVPEWEEKSAPDLSDVGARVRTDWLGSFLRDPEVVRPWGFHPGFGSRHPDFRLTDDEAGALADYLSARTGDAGATGGFEPEELHPFSMRKAEALLRDKQPCLGCHRLGGEGGRIGPDLSSLGSRLQADYVYRIVEDPQAVIEGTVMPKIEMPEATLELIVSYLLQQRLPRERAVYPSLAATPPLPRGREGIEGTYVTRCAACHGVGGKGDGFNAAYLPTPPTPHADSASMSTRPDDTLFDGIYAGGYILGRSHRMPAWGFTLGRDEIRGLVAHLRTLCRCDPPAWTRGHR